MGCYNCVYFYCEPEVNFSACTHPEYNIEEPDDCPGEYSIADAKADAKADLKEKY